MTAKNITDEVKNMVKDEFRSDVGKKFFAQHQAELLPTSVIKTGDDGITRQSFLGYTLNKHGFSGLTRVTVNEYDEAITKVIIEEHDGAETLVPLLEPKPDPQIPGLYHW